ncbi:MAG: LapA family protein [Peptostreptococcaceae bacterium]|nr:LapA family protein [Peptostreptococcaceae bacterium]
MQKNFIISLVFAIIVAIFAIQNSNNINVNFLTFTFTTSQAVIIFVSALLGGIIASLFGLIREFKLKRLNKEINKKLIELENNLKEKEEILNKSEEIDINKELNLEKE